MTERRRLAQDKAALAERLAGAQAEIRTLRGIIPVCSRCGTVRNDPDYRRKLEKYAESHAGAALGEGLCPDCRSRLYPDIEDVDLISSRRTR